MILQKPPKHGLGYFIPKMWARQSGKRFAQEQAMADDLKPGDLPPMPILAVQMKVGDPIPPRKSITEMWASIIMKDLQRQQELRNQYGAKWLDAMTASMAPAKKRPRRYLLITRLKFRWGMLRLALARWIAGNQWPDPW